MFEDAAAEGAAGRKQPQGSTFASMAFADAETENAVCTLRQHCFVCDYGRYASKCFVHMALRAMCGMRLLHESHDPLK